MFFKEYVIYIEIDKKQLTGHQALNEQVHPWIQVGNWQDRDQNLDVVYKEG